MKLDARCRNVELILCDVDGVLTDGGVIFDNEAIESKQFHVRDGVGIKLWQRAGYRFGLITGRSSHIVKVRAAELGIHEVRQGVESKLQTAREVWEKCGLTASEVCFIGDDLPDLATVSEVGLGIAVADAVPEVVQAADHVTRLAGGRGAVREVIELILKSKLRWKELVERFAS